MSGRVFVHAKTIEELSHRLRTERRGERRQTISVPAKVIGSDPKGGQWTDATKTLNVSPGGAALLLSRQVMIGDVLYVQIALPARFRNDSDPSATYNAYGRIRHIELHDGQQIVRLQFLERKPIRRETLIVTAKY